MGVGLGLLQTQNIRGLLVDKLKKSLLQHSPNAIHVPGYNSQNQSALKSQYFCGRTYPQAKSHSMICGVTKETFMPSIGQAAPQFTAQAVVDGGDFKEISLSDYKGRYVVLFFYPLDFTFVCPTEITQFREHLKDFREAGAEVIGVSVDSVHSHKRWIKDDLGDLHYPLVGDITKQISRDYGVLLADKGISTRGTFIIDPEGAIQYMGIHNLSVGRDAREILRVLQALKSGELCGAGWRPGDKHVSVK
jgi:peroxiredoxin (alkyl hydroperoxide reductase subunit C)